MASLVVRDLADEVKDRLRVRAASHGRSMEAEVRAILTEALMSETKRERTLGDLVAELFGPEHGFDLEPYLPDREPGREPPAF
jgi:plasmid stability protein